MCVAVYDNQLNWFTGIAIGSFLLASGLGVLYSALWNVSVSEDKLTFRNTFGIVKHYKVSDITYAVLKKSGARSVYIGERKIFTIDERRVSLEFELQLIKMNIPTKTVQEFKGMDENNLLITVTMTYKVLAVFDSVCLTLIGSGMLKFEGGYNVATLVT